MNEAKIESRYGPGGRNCACCGPGKKERKVYDRAVQHRVRQKAKQLVKQQAQESE